MPLPEDNPAFKTVVKLHDILFDFGIGGFVTYAFTGLSWWIIVWGALLALYGMGRRWEGAKYQNAVRRKEAVEFWLKHGIDIKAIQEIADNPTMKGRVWVNGMEVTPLVRPGNWN